MPEVRWMDELTHPDFSQLVKETDIAIIPVGSLEEHALHGLLGTDSYIAEELTKRIARKAKAVLFPTIRFGHGLAGFDSTMWPGTINISAETMISLYTEVGLELVRHGLNRLLFVSGHWNNATCLDIAMNKIWRTTGAPVGVFEWFIVLHKEAYEYTNAIHADRVETSLLLATDKAGLVQMDKAVVNPLPAPVHADEKWLWERGVFAKITAAYDEKYMYKGGFGEPAKATKAIGDELLDKSVDLAIQMMDTLKKHVNQEKINRFRSSPEFQHLAAR